MAMHALVPSDVWIRLKQNKPVVAALMILWLWMAVACLAPLLANEKPLYMQYHGQHFFPAFSFKSSYLIQNNQQPEVIDFADVDWKQLPMEKVIWPPVVYSPGKSDFSNSNFAAPGGRQLFVADGKTVAMPTRFRHWLGTGNLGEDLASGLIHGARISLSVGVISMAIASVIGIAIGMFAGYFGDRTIVISRAALLLGLIGMVLGWFYAFQLRSIVLMQALEQGGVMFFFQLLISIFIFISIVFIFWKAEKPVSKIRLLGRKLFFPADMFCSRLIEIFVSMPVLMIIIIIAAIAKPSVMNVMLIIGLTNWTVMARLIRAEMLRIRTMEYIQAAHALGYSHWRIIFRHALPNAIAPVFIAMAFGIANAILIESSLSFLGISVPSNVVTWGSLLNEARTDSRAWWMIVFPGISILITVLSFNLIGEGLRDSMDVKLTS